MSLKYESMLTKVITHISKLIHEAMT